jgi:phage shock protein PspC (stress-responsive transcriptional regulator)
MEKKLCLSRNNKVIAGVCGGVSEYFKVDPTLIRIIWVIICVMGFFSIAFGTILYIICWAVMPLQD